MTTRLVNLVLSILTCVILLKYCRGRARSSTLSSVWENPDELSVMDTSVVCQSFPSLTRSQFRFCRRHPDAMSAAFSGLHLAVQECVWQLRRDRWNCSSLAVKSRNPFSHPLVLKGYRESAFVNALLAAGMMTQISRACALGNLPSCGCLPEVNARRDDDLWRRSTDCAVNLDYASRFTRRFLDKRFVANDLPYRAHFHNNRVGRRAVKTSSRLYCKCHGLSGSCQAKTCWKMAPGIRNVAGILKKKFLEAVLVNGANSAQVVLKSVNASRLRKTQLVYFESSPTYCDANVELGVFGTSGRLCNRTLDSTMSQRLAAGDAETSGDDDRGSLGSCEGLCCGRGYNVLPVPATEQCRCQFFWCCRVVCEQCPLNDPLTVCK